MEKVLEGVVIGVSSGVMLGLVFWLTGFTTARIEKRDQIRHLASEIARFRESIYSATDLEVVLGKEKRDFSKDQVRKAHYDDMRRIVEQILQGRASRLSFHEIRGVRDALYPDHFPGVVLNDAGYDKVFHALESIGWLGLPPRSV